METEYSKIRKIILKKPLFEFNDKIELKDLKILAEVIEEQIEKINSTNIRFQRKLFTVFVELIQNAFRHSVQRNDIKFIINTSENKLFYLCENLIYTNEVSKLENQLKELNLLNKEQKKEYYKNIIRGSNLSGMPRVSMGLCVLSIKTDKNLLFNFTKINEKHSLFSIITTVTIEH